MAARVRTPFLLHVWHATPWVILAVIVLRLVWVYLAKPSDPTAGTSAPSRAAPSQPGAAPESLDEGEYQVAAVLDGDTLVLANGARVRLLGVDTPEVAHDDRPEEPLAEAAAEFARTFLAGGRVQLRMDRERVDKYGRFLAYAFVEERMLNEELLRAGLARGMYQYPYSDTMKRRFRKAEDEARADRRGAWGE